MSACGTALGQVMKLSGPWSRETRKQFVSSTTRAERISDPDISAATKRCWMASAVRYTTLEMHHVIGSSWGRNKPSPSAPRCLDSPRYMSRTAYTLVTITGQHILAWPCQLGPIRTSLSVSTSKFSILLSGNCRQREPSSIPWVQNYYRYIKSQWCSLLADRMWISRQISLHFSTSLAASSNNLTKIIVVFV
jgi:hypothetical protein